MTGTGMSPTAAQEHRPHGTLRPSAHPTGSDALRAVDTDVPGAVRGVLAELLARRLAAAEAIDPLFARDLAARVARFTEDGGKFNRSRLGAARDTPASAAGEATVQGARVVLEQPQHPPHHRFRDRRRRCAVRVRGRGRGHRPAAAPAAPRPAWPGRRRGP